jgi:hypothetical protein
VPVDKGLSMISYKKILFLLIFNIYASTNGFLSSLHISSKISPEQRALIEKQISETQKTIEDYKYTQGITLINAVMASLGFILYGYALFKEGTGLQNEFLISTLATGATASLSLASVASLEYEKNQKKELLAALQKQVQESRIPKKR